VPRKRPCAKRGFPPVHDLPLTTRRVAAAQCGELSALCVPPHHGAQLSSPNRGRPAWTRSRAHVRCAGLTPKDPPRRAVPPRPALPRTPLVYPNFSCRKRSSASRPGLGNGVMELPRPACVAPHLSDASRAPTTLVPNELVLKTGRRRWAVGV